MWNVQQHALPNTTFHLTAFGVENVAFVRLFARHVMFVVLAVGGR
jgi:hypothetical protein